MLQRRAAREARVALAEAQKRQATESAAKLASSVGVFAALGAAAAIPGEAKGTPRALELEATHPEGCGDVGPHQR